MTAYFNIKHNNTRGRLKTALGPLLCNTHIVPVVFYTLQICNLYELTMSLVCSKRF